MNRRALASEGGFTMAVTMLALLVVLGLSVAAFGAAGGDIGLGQRSTDEKKAYAGAEAGLAYYLQKLSQDNDYWTKCTTDPDVPSAQNPVNQPWTGLPTDPDPRVFKTLPSDPTVKYTIELLPRNALCNPADNTTMIDPEQGALRIRTTGVAGPPGSRRVKRSIVTTLRRNGFLDFIYVTDLETADPVLQGISTTNSFWPGIRLKRVAPAQAAAAGAPPDDTIPAWADQPTTCQRWYDGDRYPDGLGRSTAAYEGSGYYDAGSGTRWNLTSIEGTRNVSCSRIQFAPTDVVAGPFHSNDTIRTCGSPAFGRAGRADRIEFWAMVPTDGCASATPTYNSTPKTGAAMSPLYPPATNASLKQTVYPPYRFTGKTTITLNDQNMTVTSGGSTTTKALPVNGLVYVQSDPAAGAACPAFDAFRPYLVQPTCGDLYVQGTYGKSLTIAADRDIVVTGNLTQTAGSDSLLGLIANKHVRVQHQVASYPCDENTAESNATPQNRTIEAAILSIGHVFGVDNYQCGNLLGTLTVKGAIAQKYRGAVGTGGATGYVKNYQYDDRFRYRSPPYFLAPVQSAWRPLRSTEQSPAR